VPDEGGLTSAANPSAEDPDNAGRRSPILRFIRRHPRIVLGGFLLSVLVALSLLAPLIAPYDPFKLSVATRLRPPSAAHWFGTDAYGRDVLTRTLYGGRISLLIAVAVACCATLLGTAIGLVAGYFRVMDAVVMRVMDGLMAIPGILLAVAMLSLSKASVQTVIIAITIPEIPRVVRLVRAVVLSLREQTFVSGAIAAGSRIPRVLLRHVLPNATTPIIVQATYIAASAVLIEAYLGFLGVGTPPEIPSWGNIIAEGRNFIMLAIWSVLFPGLFLGTMVLSINVLGDGVRDMLDPRIAKRI
jgi:peptide/nickel transport system permease protein